MGWSRKSLLRSKDSKQGEGRGYAEDIWEKTFSAERGAGAKPLKAGSCLMGSKGVRVEVGWGASVWLKRWLEMRRAWEQPRSGGYHHSFQTANGKLELPVTEIRLLGRTTCDFGQVKSEILIAVQVRCQASKTVKSGVSGRDQVGHKRGSFQVLKTFQWVYNKSGSK